MVDWNQIQDKWQKEWAKAELGKSSLKKGQEKFMMIFAYPGISGFLHVGHMRGFSYTDAICRYQRMKGKEVCFPVGTHASGNQAISFAKKVKENDQDWINYLIKNGCPEEKVKELTSPEKIIEYFNHVYVNDYWKKFGFLADWDRFTCTTYKDYEKFIQWQFKKLHEKELLVQKPYYATACLNCGPVAVDPSETDISKGGHAEKNEYTLLKFKFGNDYLIAATLRPETIYGQTNLWINPEADYVKVKVNKENWIVSAECAQKLNYQKEDVLVGEDVNADELIGKKALAPGIEKEIIILPATFCDPNIGTGIVTCVPSDAPYDYLALEKIKQDYHKYGLENLDNIKLIPIIETKGYGEFPAKEIVEKNNITDLDDPRMKEVTQEIYKAGFHMGTMRDNCGPYAGKKVQEAKELMKESLLESGQADLFYDLSEEVICRCGEKVIIKKIDDQWFIKYSDQELTERSKEQVKEMTILPQEYYENMPQVLDWFSDRACARLGNWLGSKFPYDDKWTIEPISDSTLYPSYYIVSKFINNGTLKIDDLTEEFFDYVFLGKGKGQELWKEVKEEFDYFYPLDFNLGGKEHKTVHFPVFLMNHVAILPESKWPKGIFVNWWVTGEGAKISKSKGGAVPIPDAINNYGVDAMRLYYAHIGSPHLDVVWTEDIVRNYKNNLEKIHTLISELKELDKSKGLIDDWLNSRVQEHLKNANEAMKVYNLRDFSSIVYYNIVEDIKWYLRREGGNKKTINNLLDIWIKLMNPITPHLSEEVNNNEQLVSISDWPKENHPKINQKYDAGEEIIKITMEGMRNVLKLAKIENAQEFDIFIAEDWLYELFEIVSREIKVTRNIGEIMKKVLEEEKLSVRGKEISKIVQMLVKDVSKLPKFILSKENELEIFNEAQEFLSKEFKCKINIINSSDSNEPKAKSALPGKPGVLVK
jgi:leucyl-tRNA synthetase